MLQLDLFPASQPGWPPPRFYSLLLFAAHSRLPVPQSDQEGLLQPSIYGWSLTGPAGPIAL